MYIFFSRIWTSDCHLKVDYSGNTLRFSQIINNRESLVISNFNRFNFFVSKEFFGHLNIEYLNNITLVNNEIKNNDQSLLTKSISNTLKLRYSPFEKFNIQTTTFYEKVKAFESLNKYVFSDLLAEYDFTNKLNMSNTFNNIFNSGNISKLISNNYLQTLQVIKTRPTQFIAGISFQMN